MRGSGHNVRRKMENSVDTYFNGIIEQLPTVLEKKFEFTPASRQPTKITLQFIATYDIPEKGECYVARTLTEKFTKENTDETLIVQISSTLITQLKKISTGLKGDFDTLKLESAPSDLVKNLSYKVWLNGNQFGSRYEGSLIT